MRQALATIGGLIKGFGVTAKYLFRPAVTVQYPTERKPIPPRFRGLLINDVPRCISCELCAKACPVDCFTITWEKSEGGKRKLTQFDINMYTCMFCGLCTEVCPTECLTMTGGYESATFDRGDLVFRFMPTDKHPVNFPTPERVEGGMIGSAVAGRAAVNPSPKAPTTPAAAPERAVSLPRPATAAAPTPPADAAAS